MKKLVKNLMLLSCLISNTSLFSQISETVKDYDGNIYKTVKIGDQIWMAENLKTTHFQNGGSIDKLYNLNDWESATIKGPIYLDYDKKVVNGKDYGKIYNYLVIADPRKVCPVGWRVPTKDDWNTLIKISGNDEKSTVKLKEKGNIHWKPGYANGTNQLGFNALPGGIFNGSEIWGIGGKSVWFVANFDSDYSEFFNTNNTLVNRVELGYIKPESPLGIGISSNGVTAFGMNIRCIKGDGDVAEIPVGDKSLIKPESKLTNTFCSATRRFRLTLVEGGTAVYITYAIGGKIEKRDTGDWSVSDFFPDGTQRLYLNLNGNTIKFTLIRNGDQSMARLIDDNGRSWDYCD